MVEPAISDAIRRAAQALRDAGVEVIPFQPAWLDEARTLWWEIFGRAVRLLLESSVVGHEADVDPNLVEFIEWTQRMPKLTAERLLDVEIQRDMLRARVLADMRDVPVLLCPVAAVTAFRHGEREWTIDGQTVQLPRCVELFGLVQPAAESWPRGAGRRRRRPDCRSASRSWRGTGKNTSRSASDG